MLGLENFQQMRALNEPSRPSCDMVLVGQRFPRARETPHVDARDHYSLRADSSSALHGPSSVGRLDWFDLQIQSAATGLARNEPRSGKSLFRIAGAGSRHGHG